MLISGIITGTLQYGLKREFLANSLALREVENYIYEIYSVDFGGNPIQIQNQIQQQFANVSGDVHVHVFETENTYFFPSDSLNAARYKVAVEIKKPVANIGIMFPELQTPYYTGLDPTFINNYGQYLLGFHEDFNFATNDNGNREFSHSISFGLQTGWAGDNTITGRKVFAQGIASYIFTADTGTTFGIETMVGQIATVANTNIFRNYFTESYDLQRNVYSFSRKRIELPFDASGTIINLSNSISMIDNGTIEVSERASTEGNISFSVAKINLENYLSNAYTRCNNIYGEFYNSNVIAQDPQYNLSSFLPLINTPMKTVRVYNSASLTANYDVTFTNNPNFSGDGTITSQDYTFDVTSYNEVQITHSFDYTINRIINSANYISTLINNTTGQSPASVSELYNTYVQGISAIFPNLNLIRINTSWPNIKTKASAKLIYSNNPTYFVNINGILFKVLDMNIENKTPSDIVNEFKIINRPTKKSVLSYGYQTQKGEININIKTMIGKQYLQFFPDGVGSFLHINDSINPSLTLFSYLQAIYMYAGQVFLNNFSNIPTTAFNWFIQDSKYSFDSDGNLNVSLNYIYTIKKRLAPNFP